ncbi:hypothetical protein [Sinorhizobium medicae]
MLSDGGAASSRNQGGDYFSELGGEIISESGGRIASEFAHHRSREWIRQQLRHPADLGAVKITEVGAIMIAAITRLGADHVVLERAKRPTIGA